MGTRGLYGFRKNGVDKTTYNHYDSYPEGLGSCIADFCANTSEDEMNQIYDSIEMIDTDSTPTKEQIDFCVNSGFADLTVSTRKTTDWYCLLRNLQGDLDSIKQIVKEAGKAYMPDNHEFIKDSLFCEYGYIINLDTHMLEFWVGFQHEPQVGNRYGVEADDGYYPCKMLTEFPLDHITDADEVVQAMNAVSNLAEEEDLI